jgi:UDP-glucose 4-epimerase
MIRQVSITATSPLPRRSHGYFPPPLVPTVEPACPRGIWGYASQVRVVITGATGNIGTALLRAASRAPEPWRVVGVARRRPPDVAPYAGASWTVCDPGADGAAERLVPVLAVADAVVHLAWAIQPAAGEAAMSRTNLGGSRAVLRACGAAGVRPLVCASSVAAYRTTGRGQRVPESWPVGGIPDSAYSRQKAALERLLDGFQATHPHVGVARVRPCAVVSADAGAQLASWLISPLLPARLAGRRLLPLPAWRGLRVQLIHADDVADALRRIVETGATGAYNLAAEPVLDRTTSPTPVSSRRSCRTPLLVGAAGLAWRVGLQPLHPGWLALADRAALVITGRARESLGWDPRVSASAALRDIVQAIRDFRAGSSAPLAPGADARALRIGRPMRQSQR